MAQGKNFVSALLVSTASVSLIVAGTTVPAVAQAATGSYKIESQPLGQALMQLSRQANVDIVAPAKITRGRVGKAVAAESVDAALRQMLSGSGLTFKRAGSRYVIQSGNAAVQGGNAEAAPARAEAPAAIAQVSVLANASTVVDARTGAALKGALVEIVETGEKASTGDLGEFRFPGKNGSYNIRISYLGYPQYEQFVDLKDGRATSGILLSDGSATGEIIVTAYQTARAQALNQERTAANTSTVVSSDLLGQFDGATISDALRRSAGVSFRVDPFTGEGTNVTVRGLGPEFNTVSLNGLRLPVGDGVSRAPNLGNILADSVSKITINKTLLPSQDGSGTGALIDIETRGPLDRPNRYVSLSADYGRSARDFADDRSVSGTASWKFGGSKNFGLSVSAQYRERDVTNLAIGTGWIYPEYLPLEDNGRPVTSRSQIHPLRQFPFEDGADRIFASGQDYSQTQSQTRNLALGAAAQWSIGEHTNLRLDYNRNTAESEFIGRSVALNLSAGYVQLPIEQLNGEIRRAFVWEDAFSPGFKLSVNRGVTLTKSKQTSDNVSFRGETDVGRWELDYKAGYARGVNKIPINASAIAFSPELTIERSDISGEVLNNTVAGRLISLFPVSSGGKYVLPGLNPSGYAAINDPGNYIYAGGGDAPQRGENRRITAALDVKYNLPSPVLKYVQAGIFYENSRNSNEFLDSVDFSGAGTIGEVGLPFGPGLLNQIGVPNTLQVSSIESIKRFFDVARAGENPLITPTFYDAYDLGKRDNTTEVDIAGYLQAHVQIGKVEVVGGVRVEQVRTSARSIYNAYIFNADGSFDVEFANQNIGIQNLKGRNFNVLPRLTVNFRPNEYFVARAGYYLSITRPNISLLNSARSIGLDLQPFYGPEGNQPILGISQGNPGLKASTTDNFDVSIEWYDRDVGVIKAGAFYKPTKRAFFSAASDVSDTVDISELPDDPRFSTPNLFIINERPENSPYLSKNWGVEFSVERRFKKLPGLLGGLGIYANYTYTDSERVSQLYYAPEARFIEVKGVRYNSQPKHSGTFAVTYSKGGLDGSVAYTRQSRYLTSLQAFGMSEFREAIDSLDAKLEHRFALSGMDLRIYAEGSNLLKGPNDSALQTSIGGQNGSPKAISGSSFTGGRALRLGLTATF